MFNDKIKLSILPSLIIMLAIILPQHNLASNPLYYPSFPLFYPEPQAMLEKPDEWFNMNGSTTIVIKNSSTSSDSMPALILAEEILNVFGFQPQIKEEDGYQGGGNAIVVGVQGSGDFDLLEDLCNQRGIYTGDLKSEGYILDVAQDFIVVAGRDSCGAFYGAQTLRQLLNQHEQDTIRGLTITDYPDMKMRLTHMFGGTVLNDSMKERIKYFASLKLNSVILEDGRFYHLDNATYREGAQEFFDYCRRYFIDPIPELQSFGHAAHILRIDPHCAEGSFVENQPFKFVSDTASFCSVVVSVANNGFEVVSNNDFADWGQDDSGFTIFDDTMTIRSGRHSCRITRTNPGTSRLWQNVFCNPNTEYVLTAYIKVLSVTGKGAYIEVYGVQGNGQLGDLLKVGPRLTGSTLDWQKETIVFNSDSYETLRVYVRLQEATGTAWFDDLPHIYEVQNGGFEEVNSENWAQNWDRDTSNPAKRSVELDPFNPYQGYYSCRIVIQDTVWTARAWQDVPCDPNCEYKLNAYAKVSDVRSTRGGAYMEVYGIKAGILSPNPLRISEVLTGSTNWCKLTCCFNSGEYDTLRIYIRLQEASGQAWFDEVKFGSHVPLVNVIKTEITSPVVKDELGTTTYTEGFDYELIDGTMQYNDGYSDTNNPTKIVRLPQGRIGSGAIILVSYDYVSRVNHPTVPYCPSEPRVYQIMFQAIENVIDYLTPNFIHIGHDEPTLMNSDSRDRKRKMTNSQLFAEDINKLDSCAQNSSPAIRLIMWDDALNPYHYHYIADPPLEAIDSIPQDVIPVAWFYRSNQPLIEGDSSLSYYALKGFNSLGTNAGYYVPSNPYNWSQVIKKINEATTSDTCLGLINTAWSGDWKSHNWDGLPIAAEYAWSWNKPDTTDLPYNWYELNRKFGDIFAPAPPTGLVLMPGTNNMTLVWNVNREGDLSGYNIYRGETSGGPYLKIGTVQKPDTTFLDSAGGTEYYYVVTAFDTTADTTDTDTLSPNESAYSEEGHVCVSGQPSEYPQAEPSYFVWYEYGVWKIRWTSSEIGHYFVGQISADTIYNVKSVNFERGDYWSLYKKCGIWYLAFHGTELEKIKIRRVSPMGGGDEPGFDGLNFEVGCDPEKLGFCLDNVDCDHIYIGQYNAHPTSNSFTLYNPDYDEDCAGGPND